MKKVYLVTSKSMPESEYEYGDDLYVEGVFSTFETAQKYAASEIDITGYEYKVTQMAIDEPGSELDGGKYPFASYFEWGGWMNYSILFFYILFLNAVSFVSYEAGVYSSKNNAKHRDEDSN